MKKSITKTLLLILMVILTACGGTNQQADNQEDIKDTVKDTVKDLTIVTSFYPLYTFTKNIAKDVKGVAVEMLSGNQSGCLHDYVLTTSDMKMLEKADIIILNGAMESFMDKGFENKQLIIACDGLELLNEGVLETYHFNEEEYEDEDHEHDHVHSFNPHLWVSPGGAAAMVDNITKKLIVFNPENKELYSKNAEKYINKLNAQKEKMESELSTLAGKKIVTFHEAFDYFAKDFKLNIITSISHDPDTEPSAGEIAEVIKAIKEQNVEAIFTEPENSSKASEIISRETGVKVFVLDPISNGEKTADYDDYFERMDENTTKLIQALKL